MYQKIAHIETLPNDRYRVIITATGKSLGIYNFKDAIRVATIANFIRS